jgi:hypothetical protein
VQFESLIGAGLRFGNSLPAPEYSERISMKDLSFSIEGADRGLEGRNQVLLRHEGLEFRLSTPYDALSGAPWRLAEKRLGVPNA